MAFQSLKGSDVPSEDKRERDDVIEEDKVVLKRIIGLAATISFILGLIIGTGIFLTPAGVLRGASGSIGISFVVWIIAACIKATEPMCLLELALYYRQSGGSYVFLSSVYGPALGFVYIAVNGFVTSPCSSAIQSLMVVKFLVTPIVGDCDVITEYAYKAGATCVFMLAVFINSMSAVWATKTQVSVTVVKVGALLLVIAMGFVKMITDGTEKLKAPFDTTGDFDWSEIPSGFFSAYWALGGCSYIVNVTEEVEKPQKTMIRGMVISLTCVTILYLLANLAYFAVLTPEEIMASDAVAALFAVRVVGVRWSFIIWLCVVISAAGSLNGTTFSNARTYFVAARSKQFPFILSTIHVNRRTPMAAILCALPTTIILIWSGNLWTIINLNQGLNLTMDILVIISVLYLRWRLPNRELDYKAPLLAPIIYLSFNIVLMLMTVITNPAQIGITAAIFVVTLICYFLYRRTWTSPRAGAVAKSANDFLQKLSLSVKQEAATY